jgi:hypothetical protein
MAFLTNNTVRSELKIFKLQQRIQKANIHDIQMYNLSKGISRRIQTCKPAGRRDAGHSIRRALHSSIGPGA